MDNNYIASLVIRFLVAGTVVVCISIAAEKLKNPLLAGILMMLPSITIVSMYFIGSSMGANAARDVLYWSLIGLPVWIAYAVSLYYFLQNTKLELAIIYSMAVFIAGAILLAIIKNRFVAA